MAKGVEIARLLHRYVTIGHRKMVKVEVARTVLQDLVAALFAETRCRLERIISDDPAAQEKLAADLAESERRLNKIVAELLPVVN